MIDHLGFAISDYARAKAFYAQALAPLGYVLVKEVPGDTNPSRFPAAGFGQGGKPDFWIGGEGRLEKPLHVAIVAGDRAAVDAFFQAALAAGGRDNGAPGLRTIRIITPLSCSTPTAITSRRCATSRPNA